LIKKDKNWKEFVLIKQNRFYIGKYWADWLYNHMNDNVILFNSNDLYLWNANCYFHYNGKHNELSTYDWNITELKLKNWESITIKKSSDGKQIRTSNGIDINCELNYKGKLGRYGLYYNNGSEIFLALHEDTFWLFVKITSILSEIKRNWAQCEKVNDNMLKVWDSTYEFNCSEDINNIAKWINNYKFDD
jgi:hypothetical protein